MSTISELMAGKKPGEIKVNQIGWANGHFFRPYYVSEGHWYGLDDSQCSMSFRHKEDNWQLYTEPKAKVVWHEYARTKQFEAGSTAWLVIPPDLLIQDVTGWSLTPTGRTVEVEQE